MTDDKKPLSRPRHTLMLNERENLSVTGVIDVISFDEETVAAETEKGALIVRGTGLHVRGLNLDLGELEIDGEISDISYEDAAGPRGKSFISRIFR